MASNVQKLEKIEFFFEKLQKFEVFEKGCEIFKFLEKNLQKNQSFG